MPNNVFLDREGSMKKNKRLSHLHVTSTCPRLSQCTLVSYHCFFFRVDQVYMCNDFMQLLYCTPKLFSARLFFFFNVERMHRIITKDALNHDFKNCLLLCMHKCGLDGTCLCPGSKELFGHFCVFQACPVEIFFLLNGSSTTP